jgi:Phage-related minor tail protein
VGQGKMTMQDLASSLSTVLPIAASAHISFQQVGGAIATMTGMGMSARQATQDLAFTIRSLLHPSGEASQEMRAMGVNALDVSKNLGHAGLTGTMQELSDAVLKNTRGGSVFLGYMQKMTPAAQGLARQILAGSITTKQLRDAVYNLNPQQAKLISLFDTAATSATGLKQTYAGAMSAMTGGATGLNTSLMLTGAHARTFADNVRAIGDSAKGAGSNVKGWGQIQGEANFQIGSAVKAIEAMGDALGLALLPSVTAVLKPITSFFELIAKNKAAAIAFAAILGTLLAGALGAKLAGALSDAKAGLSTLFDVIGDAPSAISSMASGFASAASSVASFTVQTVKQAGEAMVATGAWIAEHAAAAASFIAENVAMAASATAAFIAENAATLGIVAGIALLVAGIIYLATHWKQVWDGIKKVALDAWHFLDSNLIQPFEHGVADLVDWVRDHWKLLATILATVLLGPVGLLIAFIATHWDEFRNLTSRLISDVTGFFRRLPGDIMSELRSLPGQLLSLGRDLINGFINGITGRAGGLISTVQHLAGDVSGAFKDVLGMFSPSRVFAEHGRNIVRGLVAGISGESPSALAAVRRLGGSLSLGGAGGGGYGASGGVLRIQLEMAGGSGNGLNELFWTWLREMVRAKGGGGPYSVQKALGRTWPAG